MSSSKNITTKTKLSSVGDVSSYSRRLSYANIANKTQKSTIEKLKNELNNLTDINKELSIKMDRVQKLSSTREVLIRSLKEELNKIKSEKQELQDENKSLVEELYHLRCQSKINLSATQDNMIKLSQRSQEEQENLRQQLILMKGQVDALKKELSAKELQIGEFVKKTKNMVHTELIKLGKTASESAMRLNTSEQKTKDLCRSIVNLLKIFYQRRMARRLLSEKLKPIKDNDIRVEKNRSMANELSNISVESIKKLTSEAMLNMKSDLKKENPATIASLRAVIENFHVIIHKTNFSEELGIFLYNNIVNPFLYEAQARFE